MKNLKSLSVLLMASMALVLGSCLGEDENPCPDARFTITVDSTDFSYTLTAENLEDIIYSWYIDGQLVETEDLDSLRDNLFRLDLDSGEYTVCIKGESEICGGEFEFCLPVSIEDIREHDDCPDLAFEVYRLGEREFKFLAEFEGRDSIEYSWVVDDDTVLTEFLGSERHHKLIRVLEPGIHYVCIVAKVEGCPAVYFCREVNTDENPGECPQLYFEVANDEDGNYVFEADFEGMDSTQYKWYVNDNYEDVENFEGHTTDHRFERHFGNGYYEVCIKNYRPDCREKFCYTFSVESACRELYFKTERESDGTFVFVSDFSLMELTPYKWYIDGEFVEAENFNGDSTDNILVKSLSEGHHSVCIKAEIEGCGEVEYCEEVEVGGETAACRELAFNGERDGESMTYVFTADFEGRDDVKYEWYVKVNGEWVGGESREPGSADDHVFSWQFEQGVSYTVCLKQHGCDDTKVCEEFIIN